MKNIYKATITIIVLLVLLFQTQYSMSQTWENISGHARDIAADGDSTDIVWTIGRDFSAYLWNDSYFT
jgi:hypothetical protein